MAVYHIIFKFYHLVYTANRINCILQTTHCVTATFFYSTCHNTMHKIDLPSTFYPYTAYGQTLFCNTDILPTLKITDPILF